MSKHRFTEKILEPEEVLPKGWFFKIHEDVDPDQIGARLRYGTDRAIEMIDLRGRQRTFRTQVGWDKENVAPANSDDSSSTASSDTDSNDDTVGNE
ncbi:uncharacterized protein BDZ99DRAFT_463074 [Mytilinidion resinicola]|uniref:Uncharacterized protein n=1 Tax=Mytilinidion resinicola TaxID=574789 RepID=A0A6A6YPK9_9PEZI|nr:uncharacterized protein BDZ99DRAFT_463074 [Mytilinidion resinicola]KAF2810499.1 hypothetical protein BDZ99DRAFT_463074 [Mytilinidion resinicola]